MRKKVDSCQLQLQASIGVKRKKLLPHLVKLTHTFKACSMEHRQAADFCIPDAIGHEIYLDFCRSKFCAPKRVARYASANATYNSYAAIANTQNTTNNEDYISRTRTISCKVSSIPKCLLGRYLQPMPWSQASTHHTALASRFRPRIIIYMAQPETLPNNGWLLRQLWTIGLAMV